jgi:hypothetical protein
MHPSSEAADRIAAELGCVGNLAFTYLNPVHDCGRTTVSETARQRRDVLREASAFTTHIARAIRSPGRELLGDPPKAKGASALA